ncbi:hypothetical protein ACWD4F_07550 [Streptomyces aureus]|uniref:Uncharacterized protein n=1 Tax=Streptomyces triticiradicis TaxID=2651189 RepID=A0A7J5DMC6_9ACTN|nr:hypothetical protein [Streptomyces triticiradicis]KAB1989815.1 hypothetical protein F8144_05575 [Streptomyces triticiradicis]
MLIEQPPLFGTIQPVRHPADVGGLTIQQRFEAFHALNPWVLRSLARMTADCAEKGFGRIGIGMLFELLRYQYGAATRGDVFALNNDYRSRYVRLLLDEHPEWSPLFEVRALRTD